MTDASNAAQRTLGVKCPLVGHQQNVHVEGPFEEIIFEHFCKEWQYNDHHKQLQNTCAESSSPHTNTRMSDHIHTNTVQTVSRALTGTDCFSAHYISFVIY